jgi:hypothetical protein
MTDEPPALPEIQIPDPKIRAMDIARRWLKKDKRNRPTVRETEWAMRLIPEAFGLEPKKPKEETGEFPSTCSLTQLSGLYKARWPDYMIRVDSSLIHKWQAAQKLPFQRCPVHPRPGANKEYSVAECFEWFEKNILPYRQKISDLQAQGVNTDLEAMDDEEREKKEEREHKRWERAEKRG